MFNEGEYTVYVGDNVHPGGLICVGGFGQKLRVLVNEEKPPEPYWRNCRAQLFLDKLQARSLYKALGKFLENNTDSDGGCL